MLLQLIITVLCIKKYNIIVDHSNDMYMAGNNSILSMLSTNDGSVKKTKVGYTIELSPETFEKVRKHPGVIHMEEDQIVQIATEETIQDIALSRELTFVIQKDTSWGLSRISGHSKQYEYLHNGGNNVIVYVLDTGIDVTHPEFEGRAVFKYNGVIGSPDTDEQGHGTHCAGVIGSKSYGVAKKAKLYAVKILDKNGMGSISRLIEGIDFIIDDYSKINMKKNRLITRHTNIIDYLFGKDSLFLSINRKIQAVVNMSVGGSKSVALNYAIHNASLNYSIHFSTAAGNEHKDACKYSPSSSSTALTIGASDAKDYIAKFSNNGQCVNLFAPGVHILSTWPNNKTKIASGTSMAAPHVSGIMAVYLGLAIFEPDELKKRIIDDAENRIKEPGFIPFVSIKKPFASLKPLYDRLKTIQLN